MNNANIHEARELSLYATNNGALRFGRIDSVINILARKVIKGTYDATLALKLWQYIADDSAKAYAKEFCGPDFDQRQFGKATRQLAAIEIAEYYAEALSEYAEDLAKDIANRKAWSLSQIKYANAQAGFYFFNRDTMRFFGDTMANFAARYEGGKIYVCRVKASRVPAGKCWIFNPETGNIS